MAVIRTVHQKRMAWPRMDGRSANLWTYCKSAQICNKPSVKAYQLIRPACLQNTQVCLLSEQQHAFSLILHGMTSDYHNRTEHGPHEQQPGSRFLQLFDHSHTLNTVHVIGSQNQPEVSWFLIGPA